MIKNYFKIALRNLRKNKLYAFVNITGLALGITCCILIGLYIAHEWSYDKFHIKGDRIVRVTMEYSGEGTVSTTAMTGTKAGPQFKRTFPDVEQYVRLYGTSQVISYNERQFEESRFLFADSLFFDVFSFPLIKGNATTVLDAPDKIVLSGSAAKKYFGNQAAMGKTLTVGTREYQVAGIAADAPASSQIKFDFVAPFTNLGVAKNEVWFNANYFTYLLLNNKENINSFQQRVKDYMKVVTRDELKAEGSDYLTYNLEPVKRVHLYSDLPGLEPNGNILYIYILGAIAVLILCIACVNYTNLSTAQSAGRSTEIGIRKVLGAERAQLFGQFLGESFMLSFVALIIAVLAAVLLLPLFNQLTGKAFHGGDLLQPLPLLAYLALILVISFAAGVYPALILSGFKMIKVLKSGVTLTKGNNGARQSLIVFQFVVSLFLVIATIVIIRQMDYIRNKNLGYNKDHVLVLPVDSRMRSGIPELKSAMLTDPKVVNITGAYESPTYIQWGDGINTGTGDNQRGLSVNAIPVDRDFIKTFGMEIIAGSDFTDADLPVVDTTDWTNNRLTFILNETAAKGLGWTPEEAIGQTVSKGTAGKVKAVIKDFHFESMHNPVGPLVIFLQPGFTNELFVKIAGNNIPATIRHLETVWKQRVAHRPFEYHFLDEEYNTLYQAETRTGQLFATFSALAILLACLGLFALAAYATVRRTKEIGIRKVMGATVTNITTLISKDFLKLVLIALVITTPVAWYAAHKWLEGFAYRISVQWWIFILAGIVAVSIALVTVSFHAIRAALTNPVKSLRAE